MLSNIFKLKLYNMKIISNNCFKTRISIITVWYAKQKKRKKFFTLQKSYRTIGWHKCYAKINPYFNNMNKS